MSDEVTDYIINSPNTGGVKRSKTSQSETEFESGADVHERMKALTLYELRLKRAGRQSISQRIID